MLKNKNLVLGFMLIMLLAFSTGLMAQAYALDFDGTEEYVAADGVCDYITSTFTIETWFNADDVVGSQMIWAINENAKGENILVLGLSDSNIQVWHWNGSSNTALLTGSSTISAGQWYHVALTISGGTVNVFLNGVSEATASKSVTVNNDDWFSLGQEWDTAPSDFYDGKLDEVRVWNDVRTEAEIRSNMCKTLAGNEDGLVAYYKMTDGSGTSLTDNSTNSNTGTLTNMDDTNWVTSGAALGDAGTYDYSTPISVNLASNFGDDVTVGTITGSPVGVQIYRVDSAPNVTTPPAGLDQLSQSHYFGVFIVGGTSPTYTLTYNYDEHPGISNEDNLKLVSRSNNAAANWTDLNADLNTTDNTLIKTGQTGTEYILGSASDNTLPVTLSSFTVQYLDNTPILCWTTQSETSNAGWNIYRGETNEALSNEEAYLLNLSLGLIPGAGTTSLPTDYSFEDFFPVYAGSTYFYWLESVDYSGECEIYGPISLTIPENEWQNPNSPEIPKPYGLHQNYPNPFNPNTEISFMLQESCIGKLSIYNIKGQKIKTIFSN